MNLVLTRIRGRLAALGLSENAASKIAGVDLRNIKRAAANRRRVSMKTIEAAARALQTTAAFLVGHTDDPSLGLRTGGGGPTDGDVARLLARRDELTSELEKVNWALEFFSKREK